MTHDKCIVFIIILKTNCYANFVYTLYVDVEMSTFEITYKDMIKVWNEMKNLTKY